MHTCAKGLSNWFCLFVCQFASLSVSLVKNFVNLNIDKVNPLTTNNDFSRHRNSATYYQLAKSVLKIGSALAERVGQGEGGWVHRFG